MGDGEWAVGVGSGIGSGSGSGVEVDGNTGSNWGGPGGLSVEKNFSVEGSDTLGAQAVMTTSTSC